MMFNRPSWDETWMQFAMQIANRSYDPRLKVGCVIVPADNSRVLALGYNGNYSGGPNEPESNEPGQSGFIHAELNALLKMDRNDPSNKILYVTTSPCKMCCKYIVQSGINEVVYHTPYRDPTSLDILRTCNINVRMYQRDNFRTDLTLVLNYSRADFTSIARGVATRV